MQKYVIIFLDEEIKKCLRYTNKSTHKDRLKRQHQNKNKKGHVLMLAVFIVKIFLTSFKNISLSLSEHTLAEHSERSPG